MPINDQVYDPKSGNIWVTVQSTGGAYANSIVAVDPSTGAIGTVIPMGAEPNNIRVTDDGQFAYVDVPADGSIRRANLKTGVAGSIFALNIGGVSDIEAVPNSPHSFVVCTNPLEGVNTRVFDDGIPRNNTGAGGYDIKFAGTNTLMYGDGGNSLFVDTLTPTQINWTGQYNLNVTGFSYYNGLLYTAVPTVVDPIQKIVVESIPTNDILTQNIVVALSSADNRLYYLTWDFTHNKRIVSFDLSTYKEYSFIDTGDIPGGGLHLIACDNHVVAYRTYGYGVTPNLVIVRGLP